ncbi:MAG: hypothetical protein NVS2B11_09720 [Acetobacteraceae bacterium]
MGQMTRRVLLAAAAAGLTARRTMADGGGLKLGVLSDLSSSYADVAGQGSIEATKMAVADFGGAILGGPITVVSADAQNKPDVASAIARRWFDTGGVDAIIDLPVTPIALAVQEIARQKSRTVMITASAASEFTSKFCSPVSTHWADDTHALTSGTARALLAAGVARVDLLVAACVADQPLD